MVGGLVGAVDLFNYDVEWVRVCGVSSGEVDCTHPRSTRGLPIRVSRHWTQIGLHDGLLDRLSLNVPGFSVQLGMAAVHHPVGDSR